MADNDKDLTSRGVENSAEGKTDNLKGKVKDAAGGLTGDSSLQAEGKWDQAKGNVREGVGDLREGLDDAADDMKRDDDNR